MQYQISSYQHHKSQQTKGFCFLWILSGDRSIQWRNQIYLRMRLFWRIILFFTTPSLGVKTFHCHFQYWPANFGIFYQSRERVNPNARVQRVETDVLKLCVSSNGVNITVQSLVCWWAPHLGPTQCWWAPYGPNTWYWVMSSSTTCGLMEPWLLTPYHLSSHCSISLYLHLVLCCS